MWIYENPQKITDKNYSNQKMFPKHGTVPDRIRRNNSSRREYETL